MVGSSLQGVAINRKWCGEGRTERDRHFERAAIPPKPAAKPISAGDTINPPTTAEVTANVVLADETVSQSFAVDETSQFKPVSGSMIFTVL